MILDDTATNGTKLSAGEMTPRAQFCMKRLSTSGRAHTDLLYLVAPSVSAAANPSSALSPNDSLNTGEQGSPDVAPTSLPGESLETTAVSETASVQGVGKVCPVQCDLPLPTAANGQISSITPVPKRSSTGEMCAT
jgi:hypothetical protein